MADRLLGDIVLCLNVGSSSLKFAVFRVDPGSEQALTSGAVELGESSGGSPSLPAALEIALGHLNQRGLPRVTIIGHRVVHGGSGHLAPARIDAGLLQGLRPLVPLAPLHLPWAIAGIETALHRFPDVPQVACFDTAFHAGIPEHAARFPLPGELHDAGVRRYGFHGLSYEYVLSALGDPPPARLIIAHLGNGASLVAVKHGQSIDTTMAFTPGSGIMMGTRAGDLDPGLLVYLQREKGYTVDSLEQLVDCNAGLLAVGGSADMRVLVARFPHDARARLAVTMMAYAVRKTIGAYMAALGGLDVLVFTGGIGEHTPLFREEACRDLGALGIVLDEAKNARNAGAIDGDGSACRVLVVPTDEDRMIARHAGALLRQAGVALSGSRRRP